MFPLTERSRGGLIKLAGRERLPVSAASILNLFGVAQRRRDVLVPALALNGLCAMRGEESPCDARVAERSEVDLDVRLRLDEEFRARDLCCPKVILEDLASEERNEAPRNFRATCTASVALSP